MESVISRDGTRIAFDRYGKGPPMIVVGGAMSQKDFGPFAKLGGLLSDRFCTIVYDRRGRGDSTDTSPYAVEREVEDLDAVIRGVGGSAFVWGWSSGAALALTAAAQGVEMRKLAVYEPPYMVGTEGHRPPKDHEAQLRALVAAGRRGDAVMFFLVDMIGMPWIFASMMKVLPFWRKLKANAHTLPYDAAIMGDFTFPERRVAAIRVPTLIMAGEKSEKVLRNAAQAVAQTLPGVEHRMLKGQTHNISMKVLAPELKRFFGI